MELKNYLQILWRRKWIILVTLAVTTLVVTAVTFRIEPTYTAIETIRVAISAAGTSSYSDYMYADRLMNTYVKAATSGPVVEELMKQLSLRKTPQVTVEAIPNTELIQISVEDKDPKLAATTANTLTNILINQSRDLYSGGEKSSQEILSEQLTQIESELNQAQQNYETLVNQSPMYTDTITAAGHIIELKQQTYATLLDQYEQARVRDALRANIVSVFDPATIPLTPSKPRIPLNIALGILVGLIGGLGLALLFENLDSTLYTSEQIEKSTWLPTLGMVPKVKITKQLPSSSGSNPYGDAFRRIRTNVLTQRRDFPLQTLLVTSSEKREGKSTVVANLASTLAKSDQRVAVVDCDLRLPTQQRIFNLPNDQGLRNVLMQETALETAIQECSIPGVQVLTSGSNDFNPTELLGLPQMREVINQLCQHFDTILLDSPSILDVPDAVVLAPQVDGVILVVSQAHSRRELVQDACKQLSDVKARIIGVVINRTEHNGSYHYYKGKKAPEKR
jgi:polysaccharide biosynthesis transport protein